ncbi:hypothetical protein [Haloarchaeobius sp. DFWS5]|uniref:hypothetical protein n=1 Tax=Haloarchaeobius sp. DFWS5 TaxID=3446114 RepID=UPI003EC0AC81
MAIETAEAREMVRDAAEFTVGLMVVAAGLLGARTFLPGSDAAFLTYSARWLGLLAALQFFAGLGMATLVDRGVLPERGESEANVVEQVALPVTLAHEAAHAAVGVACGGSASLQRREDGRLGVDVDLRDPSRVEVFTTALAPSLVALALLVWYSDWFVAGMVSPTVGVGESVARVLAFFVLLWFGWPSRADVRGSLKWK